MGALLSRTTTTRPPFTCETRGKRAFASDSGNVVTAMMDPSSNARPAPRASSVRPLRMCIVDMNDGHENQAIRCFRLLCTEFHKHVRKTNPDIELELEHVSVRDKNEMPSRDCDLYVSSGGPGSPFDGDGKPWVKGYCDFLDHVADDNQRRGVNAVSRHRAPPPG